MKLKVENTQKKFKLTYFSSFCNKRALISRHLSKKISVHAWVPAPPCPWPSGCHPCPVTGHPWCRPVCNENTLSYFEKQCYLGCYLGSAYFSDDKVVMLCSWAPVWKHKKPLILKMSQAIVINHPFINHLCYLRQYFGRQLLWYYFAKDTIWCCCHLSWLNLEKWLYWYLLLFW